MRSPRHATTRSARSAPRESHRAWRSYALRACAIAAGGVIVFATAPVAADAAPQNRTVIQGPLYSVADGPLCGGVMSLLAAPSTTRAKATSIQVTGGFFGVSGTTAPCRVGVTVQWRNRTTGAAGSEHGWVAGTMIPSIITRLMHAAPVTGSGVVELNLQPHRPYLPLPPVRVQVP